MVAGTFGFEVISVVKKLLFYLINIAGPLVAVSSSYAGSVPSCLAVVFLMIV